MTQAIACETAGAGAPLVALHGWGLGRRAFDPVAESLAARRRLVRMDLPGCGASRPDRCGSDLDAIADALLAVAPRRAAWLGWSLGGLVALAAARRRPDAVSRVILVAASPRFPGGAEWPGIDPGALAAFEDALEGDPAGTHGRFLQFQLAGSAGARPALRALRTAAAADGLPKTRTLRAGLALLASADLRELLSALSCPVGAIQGAADPLVPAALAPWLQQAGVGVELIAGAGHAPFASHPDEFVTALAGQLD